jgi:signal transduction histidine kinase
MSGASFRDRRVVRWDLLLPAVAILVALGLIALAVTASDALAERQHLVTEGRLLRIAHGLERDLRSEGPEGAEALLRAALEREAGFVRGLRLLRPGGSVEVEVGEPGQPGTGSPVRRVELFVGPAWHLGPRGFSAGERTRGLGGGRRPLEIVLEPDTLTPPTVSRLLTPVAVAVALAVVALAVLGGRLLIRRQEQDRRAAERRRLEGLARAGAGLAHQLRTPLATLKGSCQLLLEGAETDRSVPERRRRLETMLEQSVRMDRLLARLLDFARPPEPELQTVELRVALPEILIGMEGLGTDLDERVDLDVPGGLRVRVDPEHLALMVENLLSNALAFSPEGAPIRVEAEEVSGDRAELRIRNAGPGPGDDPERWFEPYVTTRADGSGLGLPISRALAEANGGRLTLAPANGEGSVARLVLQRAAAEEGS